MYCCLWCLCQCQCRLACTHSHWCLTHGYSPSRGSHTVLTFTHSLPHSLTPSLPHSLTHPPTHSLTRFAHRHPIADDLSTLFQRWYAGAAAPDKNLFYFEVEFGGNAWLPECLLYIVPLYSAMWGNTAGRQLQVRGVCVLALY